MYDKPLRVYAVRLENGYYLDKRGDFIGDPIYGGLVTEKHAMRLVDYHNKLLALPDASATIKYWGAAQIVAFDLVEVKEEIG